MKNKVLDSWLNIWLLSLFVEWIRLVEGLDDWSRCGRSSLSHNGQRA